LHPEELAKLRARPELIESAVEECLRYDGPIILTNRYVHEDAEFQGVRIPKDTLCWAMLAAANRDPRAFPEPDRFDIERADNAHLAFGGGTHSCLGAHLARLEAGVAIGGAVQRFERLELETPDRIEWGASLFRVPGRLPVRIG
jgi:cytochrome P450